MASIFTDDLVMDTETNLLSSINSDNTHLEIIAQPYFVTRLRYRSDFENNKQRRGALQSQNNSNYTSPTIRINRQYLTTNPQYYIRVCLVAVIDEQLPFHYIHPYDLEDIDVEERNDRQNKAIWYPINSEDMTGMKSFSSLRIVKKRADDLVRHGNLYDLDRTHFIPQLTLPKDTIRRYNLHQSRLAFTVAYKANDHEKYPSLILTETTVFSDAMSENQRKEQDEQAQSPTNSTTTETSANKALIYKYAPKSGSIHGGDEILIFFEEKLKTQKLGELEIKFECETSSGVWSENAINLDRRGEMVAFESPAFPFSIHEPTTIHLTIRQKKRNLGTIPFTYLPVESSPTVCSSCQSILTPPTVNPPLSTSTSNPLNSIDSPTTVDLPPSSVLPAATPNPINESNYE